MDNQRPNAGEAGAGNTDTAAGAECRIDALAAKVARSAKNLSAHCEALCREFDRYDAPVRERARNVVNTAAEQARSHPLATFGIAFAAGAILTRVLRR